MSIQSRIKELQSQIVELQALENKGYYLYEIDVEDYDHYLPENTLAVDDPEGNTAGYVINKETMLKWAKDCIQEEKYIS